MVQKLLTVFFFSILCLSEVFAESVLSNNDDPLTVSAALHISKVNESGIYWNRPPDILFGIPILKIYLKSDGTLENIDILRIPQNPDAEVTVQMAIEAVKKSEPFVIPKEAQPPFEFIQTFLFRDDLKFKLRVLD